MPKENQDLNKLAPPVAQNVVEAAVTPAAAAPLAPVINEFDPSYVPQHPDLEQARQVLSLEAEAVSDLVGRLGDQFLKAIDVLFNCQGKVVVTGMGKSGHIASKIAATFASTGTPSFFVHPAELRHGDFGMLAEGDVVLALSGSGETLEIRQAIEPIKRLGLPIIALTGGLTSTLAQFSTAVVDVAVKREACLLNLAPTSSTTAALAMGDALAIVLMTKKGFKAEDFARSHPGGALGAQLLKVEDVMRSGVDIPFVSLTTEYHDVLSEITSKKLGFTTVQYPDGRVCGVITDGDLRRTILKFGSNVFTKRAEEIMTSRPKTISAHALAKEALKEMERYSVSDLLIVDDNDRVTGLIDLKDLLRAGLI
jgi:arabinose-5-phosphate isomerase